MAALFLLMALSLISILTPTNNLLSKELVVNKSLLEDRVKGALIGSVLGDVLGRATQPFVTAWHIKQRYGKEGLTSLLQISPCEWMYEPFKRKAAAYSGNTVLAFLTYDVCLQGRKKRHGDHEIVAMTAPMLVDLFGPEKYALDEHFSFRRYTQATLKSVEGLAGRLEQDQTIWRKERKLNRKKYHPLQENESGPLARIWPIGLVFADNSERMESLVIKQVLLTHAHPTVLAASVAITAGIAASLRGESPQQVVEHMIAAARQYEQAEQQFKPQARKLETDELLPEAIAHDIMYTSDMIRYAQKVQALEPNVIFGETAKVPENVRSQEGYLRGDFADEAVAAAAYIFLRQSDDIKSALTQAVNAGGRSALIASLVGALVGAHCGFSQLSQQYEGELELIENNERFHVAARDFMYLKNFGRGPEARQHSFLRPFLTYSSLIGAFGLTAYLMYPLIAGES